MAVNRKQKKLQRENLERMRAVQQSAQGIITAQLTDDLAAMAAYGGIAASYALIMLGYNALRQYLAAPQARHDFMAWAALAKQDRVTTSFVANEVPQDYRILSDGRRMQFVRKTAREILAKRLASKISGCSLTQGAYVAIVLAYKTLRQDLNEAAATKALDSLALYALHDVEGGRTRYSKLH